MTQQEQAADLFFATIHGADLTGWEKRLLDFHNGAGRKPRPTGRRGHGPVPSIEATLHAVREQQRRGGLRPKRPNYQFSDRQLAVAMAALEGKANDRG